MFLGGSVWVKITIFMIYYVIQMQKIWNVLLFLTSCMQYKNQRFTKEDTVYKLKFAKTHKYSKSFVNFCYRSSGQRRSFLHLQVHVHVKLKRKISFPFRKWMKFLWLWRVLKVCHFKVLFCSKFCQIKYF